MKITKFGHCCFLVEENGVRILTDPSEFSSGQNSVKGVNLILITHKDVDHLKMNSLKTILTNNPSVKIITNKSVGEVLAKEDIPYVVVENGQSTNENGILIEGFGDKHALMHSSIPQQQNTGYFIANKLFYPGDAFNNPQKPVEILALPVAAPWLKISESLDYALEIKPKICFPVHEGVSKISGFMDRLFVSILGKAGIKYASLEIEKETELN